MRTAAQLLKEIALHVKPPRGIAIVLTESPRGYPNWIATAGVLSTSKADQFAGKVAALRRSDPVIDWSDVEERIGERRRTAKWLSEV